jgi:hypothetical protein
VIGLLLVWSQACDLPYTLRHQDSLWEATPSSFRALARARKRLHFREVRSEFTPSRAFFSDSALLLLRLCLQGEVAYWYIQKGTDSLLFCSKKPSARWLRKHFLCVRGPRTWEKGFPPYKRIEVVIPLGSRPQVREDTLWRQNFAWAESLVLPWTLSEKLPPGRISALSLQARYFADGKVQYTHIGLLIHQAPDLAFDQKVIEKPLHRLPKDLQKRFLELKNASRYAYIVRIQDYYPETLAEAWGWMHLWRARQPLPLPVQLPSPSEPPVGTLP